MEVLAIIPARGGSERLPRKNLRVVAGQPLIVHSILHAVRASLVSKVVVSTDDAEIADVSRAAGAQVIMRPPELASETATSESALAHAMCMLERAESYQPDLVVFLQCTSPVRRPDDIDNAIRRLQESGADSVFSASASKWLIWRPVGPWADSFNYDFRFRKREQDRPAEWRENGSIYVFRPWVLSEHANRLGGKIAAYDMDYWSSFQIDSQEDLDLCEWILRRRRVKEGVEVLPDRIGAVVFDFDGVFTDNRVFVGQDGAEAVSCDRSDGLGLDRLRERGMPLLVLSTEKNPVVAARCSKLGLECRQGQADKLATLRAYAEERRVPLAEVVYVGNDVNDRECLRAAGCGIVVADAHPGVRGDARLVLDSAGGRGAVREVCDLILAKLRGSDDASGRIGA